MVLIERKIRTWYLFHHSSRGRLSKRQFMAQPLKDMPHYRSLHQVWVCTCGHTLALYTCICFLSPSSSSISRRLCNFSWCKKRYGSSYPRHCLSAYAPTSLVPIHLLPGHSRLRLQRRAKNDRNEWPSYHRHPRRRKYDKVSDSR